MDIIKELAFFKSANVLQCGCKGCSTHHENLIAAVDTNLSSQPRAIFKLRKLKYIMFAALQGLRVERFEHSFNNYASQILIILEIRDKLMFSLPSEFYKYYCF